MADKLNSNGYPSGNLGHQHTHQLYNASASAAPDVEVIIEKIKEVDLSQLNKYEVRDLLGLHSDAANTLKLLTAEQIQSILLHLKSYHIPEIPTEILQGVLEQLDEKLLKKIPPQKIKELDITNLEETKIGCKFYEHVSKRECL